MNDKKSIIHTDIYDFFGELEAGTYAERLGRIINLVALHSAEYKKKAKIQITLGLSPYGQGQVAVVHTLKYEHPKADGSKSETFEGMTLYFMDINGTLTVNPSDQYDLFQKK